MVSKRLHVTFPQLPAEFFVPFFALVMNHEHKEYPSSANISWKITRCCEVWRIQQRIMPMKPTPTMPILTIGVTPI
jgi:hypothetical protein